jgi:hypothetical protein
LIDLAPLAGAAFCLELVMATANKLLGTPGYNDAGLVRQIEQTVPGMAHWSGNGRCCEDCGYFGFHETIRTESGNAARSVFHGNCCFKCYLLVGKVGGSIPPQTENCKYFAPR